MSYRVEPIHHRIWDEVKEEVIDLPDIYGYRVVGSDGHTLAEAESREAAMRAASELIMLPS